MKIRLVNFRCYTDATFDIGSTGLCLISGKSGKGKTSIIMAIYFALYGTGNKVIHYGKSSCSVYMWFDNMYIHRSKRPNRLTLKIGESPSPYEGDVAQSIIHEKFGNAFNVTGYVSQGANQSFITMSPIDKLSFLEKFAFAGANIPGLKAKCKTWINNHSHDLTSSETEIDTITSVLKDLSVTKEPEFPVKCNQRQQSKVRNNEEIRVKNCDTLIKRNDAKKEILQAKYNSLLQRDSELKSYKMLIDNNNTKISNLTKELNQYKAEYIGDEELSVLELTLTNMVLNKEYTDLKTLYVESANKLEKMRDNEILAITNRLDEISSELWVEYTKEEATAELSECRRIQSLIKDRDKYNTRIQSVNYDKLVKYRGNSYKCPVCESVLSLTAGNLQVYMDDAIQVNEAELECIQKQINDYEKWISCVTTINQEISEFEYSIEDINDTIDYFSDYLSTHNNMEKERETLLNRKANSEFSSSFTDYKNNVCRMKKKIDTMEASIEALNTHIETDKSQDVIRQEIQTAIDSKKSIERLETSIRTIESETGNYECLVKKLDTDEDAHGVQLEISDCIHAIKEQQVKKSEHLQILESIRIYEELTEKKQVRDKWVNKLENVTINRDRHKANYTAALQLKNLIVEAESTAMKNTIDIINSHASIYLDTFFVDNPIVVQLQAYKDVKPSINLYIEYKSMEADISMLSGGELCRVILAFTLALSEIFNSPFIMLDESTASLDQELTTTVFECIKDNFSDKLCIIVAHQIVKGGFDTVIDLDEGV